MSVCRTPDGMPVNERDMGVIGYHELVAQLLGAVRPACQVVDRPC